MRLNQFTVLTGNLVILVPYEEFHVPKYHEWMKSEELQILTASEPLSIEDEYRMQKSWREDSDKCTFIILDKNKYTESQDEVEAMVGDTNIFLKTENNTLLGEIEIMIAEKAARGKGLGKEAVLSMLRYGIEKLNINTFEAKIGVTNDKSKALFVHLGFEIMDENDIFKEVTLSKTVTKLWHDWLISQTQSYNEIVKKPS